MCQPPLPKSTSPYILYDINTPVIFVLDIFPYQNSQDTQLLLYKELQTRDYSVKLISSKPEMSMISGVVHLPPKISNNAYEYILEFNLLLKKIETYEHPDIIIIGVPGNLLEISKEIHGDFGEYGFLISRSVSPDYVVCNMSYCDNLQHKCTELDNIVERRIESEINAFVIHPQYLDLQLSEETKRFEYISLSNDFISSKIDKSTMFYNGLLKSEISRLSDNLIVTLETYVTPLVN